MTTFRQHMTDRTVEVLAGFPEASEQGTYAVTFRLDSVDQDPRFPYLAVGYTTGEQAAQASDEAGPTDRWEARWSYAYFPPSGLEGIRVLGHEPEKDPRGAELYRREAVAEGLWREDDPAGDVEYERAERLDSDFRGLCVGLARELHEGGHLTAALGRAVPVILYDMFDPEEMFALTRAANPPELIADFLAGEDAP
ncbi:hypothetical protein [Streptomyces sp. NPDC006463]|uniref:hypothetical protein n=1 Tax=Streptomyces sp. NPDC006463 TaxID=3364746 RepID=UPI0036C6C199